MIFEAFKLEKKSDTVWLILAFPVLLDLWEITKNIVAVTFKILYSFWQSRGIYSTHMLQDQFY